MPFLFVNPEEKNLHAFRGTRTAGTLFMTIPRAETSEAWPCLLFWMGNGNKKWRQIRYFSD